MTKNEFLKNLRERLSDLPKSEVEERLDFYSEMIDDRMEEGASEEDAVKSLGSTEAVARQIISEIPIMTIVKEKMKPKRKLGAWEIVLLSVGSPIWLSLLIAAFSVLLSLYIVLWAVGVVTAWAVFGAFVGGAFGGIFSGVLFAFLGHGPTGLALVGASVLLAGLSIFAFYGCVAATKGTVALTKKIALGMKYCFVGKEKRYE